MRVHPSYGIPIVHSTVLHRSIGPWPATDFLTPLGRGRVGLTGHAYVSFSTHSSYHSSGSCPARPSSEVRRANSAALWHPDYPLRVPDLLMSIQTPPFVPAQTPRLPLGRVSSSSFGLPRCLGRLLIMTRCIIYLRPVVHSFLHDFATSGRTRQHCTLHVNYGQVSSFSSSNPSRGRFYVFCLPWTGIRR